MLKFKIFIFLLKIQDCNIYFHAIGSRVKFFGTHLLNVFEFKVLRGSHFSLPHRCTNVQRYFPFLRTHSLFQNYYLINNIIKWWCMDGNNYCFFEKLIIIYLFFFVDSDKYWNPNYTYFIMFSKSIDVFIMDR